ncbi:NGFI-A-binding protein homolog [Chrysoperla carnea]|uniref:NGFI-A-binding protein homolog n=1 Tax=Chrysoperla carnea TaxID=189513 RepID=UPI001D072685|nr:NGFI-A-binding protein homolog [Chrysoperla carnea]
MDLNNKSTSSVVKADDGNSCGSVVSSTSVGISLRRSSQQNNNITDNTSAATPGTISPRVQTPTPFMMSSTSNLTPSLRSTPSPSFVGPSSTPTHATTNPTNSITSGNNNTVMNANSNKIISRNVNGTLTVTSAPSNEAELQLYRVMQRASLLSYYDTLLEMGGDDVQQLCDAGEEEFLEIMALIGMASKPLHVRRLQKALHEWMTNPALFQLPLISINYNEFGPFTAPNPRLLLQQTAAFAALRKDVVSPDKSINSVSPGITDFQTLQNNMTPGTSVNNFSIASSSCSINKPVSSPADVSLGSTSATSSPGPTMNPGSPLQRINPVLTEEQIALINESAKNLSRFLHPVEPKQSSTKKKINKELELVMMMNEDNPRRMDEIRKYSAIYGRFDCKRKAEKPLTLHEISVNEAAAQLCKYIPALLTRRDELFPLARQVVRDCDYHKYNKINITMSPPARTRSISTNSSDSETTSTSGDISENHSQVQSGNKSPRSVGSSPGR